MMYLTSALMGILQGLTEFLPVSSSGHLTIVQTLIPGFSQPGVLFDVMLHFGTIVAVLVYFRKTIFKISLKYLGFLILASIPAAVFGFLFKHQFEAMFSNVKLVGIALLITGGLNYLTYKAQQKNAVLTAKNSFLVGLMQAVAIIPGISRTGSTIFAGIKLGLSAETAATFSLLLSVPAVLGAYGLEILSYRSAAINWGPYIVGMLFSFGVGLGSIGLLFRLLKKGRFNYLAFYCFIIGLLALIL